MQVLLQFLQVLSEIYPRHHWVEKVPYLLRKYTIAFKLSGIKKEFDKPLARKCSSVAKQKTVGFCAE